MENLKVSSIPIWAWVVYRKARELSMTMVGKNPLCHGESAMTIQQNWASLKGLRTAMMSPPSPVGKDADGRVQWQTILGSFWTPKDAGSNYISMVAGEMVANVYDLDFIGKNRGQSVIFDCGANIGFFTRFALNSGAGRVVAFEPSPDNALCLKRNLEREIAEGKVTVIEKAVWNEDTVLNFSTVNLSNPGGHHVIEQGSTGVEVSATSMDRVCEQLQLTQLDYVKMDIEGAEVHALEGARRIIQKFHPRLCVATEHTDDMFANNVAVIETMKSIAPNYRYRCTESHLYQSPSRGLVLTPFSLLFY